MTPGRAPSPAFVAGILARGALGAAFFATLFWLPFALFGVR